MNIKLLGIKINDQDIQILLMSEVEMPPTQNVYLHTGTRLALICYDVKIFPHHMVSTNSDFAVRCLAPCRQKLLAESVTILALECVLKGFHNLKKKEEKKTT